MVLLIVIVLYQPARINTFSDIIPIDDGESAPQSYTLRLLLNTSWFTHRSGCSCKDFYWRKSQKCGDYEPRFQIEVDLLTLIVVVEI